MEFLLHKKLWILFYFDHAACTNVDRRLMRGILLNITESARGQNGANPVFWVATQASCSLGIFSVGPARKSYLFHHIINSLLTELVPSRLLDTGLCFFCVFIVLEFVVSVH